MGYKNLKFDEKSVFLVTGGAGFIGSNLCEALTDMGYQVRCLDEVRKKMLNFLQTDLIIPLLKETSRIWTPA